MGRPPLALGASTVRDATREERRLWAPPGEVVLIELSAHGGGGRVERLSPAPPLEFLGRSKDVSSGLGAGLEPGSDDPAEAGYQCRHDDAQRADLRTGALLA